MIVNEENKDNKKQKENNDVPALCIPGMAHLQLDHQKCAEWKTSVKGALKVCCAAKFHQFKNYLHHKPIHKLYKKQEKLRQDHHSTHKKLPIENGEQITQHGEHMK